MSPAVPLSVGADLPSAPLLLRALRPSLPRLAAGTGRYAPQPKFQPFNFYSCVRVGDPEQLKLVRWPAAGGGLPASRGLSEPRPGCARAHRSWTPTRTSGPKTTAPERPSTLRRRTGSWTWCVEWTRDVTALNSLRVTLRPCCLRTRTCRTPVRSSNHLHCVLTPCLPNAAAPHHPKLPRDGEPA